ncbi:hypothetical protein KP509_1Z031600 [Ceratopteris richardii]|nr:hypothetical protein KP509_1Z031600 [Ceratopteris richardii]
MFYLLEARMNYSYIHGISLYGTQKIAVGFVDDTFIFAKEDEANIQNILTSLAPFSETFALRFNMRKSTLINISTCHFESLHWLGPKIDNGVVFRHLGYPMGVNISTKDKLDWVFCKIKGKLELWHSSHWPLHVRIRIVQAFLQLKASTYYSALIGSEDITLQCNKQRKLKKTPFRWHPKFSPIWEASFTFKMKIFMWRILVGHFTLGAFE